MQNRFTIVVTDGKLQGASVHADDNKALPLSSLADYAPEINAATLAHVTELEAAAKDAEQAHQEALDALKAEHAEALQAANAATQEATQKASLVDQRDATIAALEERIMELTAVPEIPDIVGPAISALHTAFITTLPDEARAAFAVPYAIVRVLVEAEQWELAKAVIAGVPVPVELEAAKQGLIDLLP